MTPREILIGMESEWPASTRRFLSGKKLASGVPPGVAASLERVIDHGDLRWIHLLLGLAWETEGQLRDTLLTTIARMVKRLSLNGWLRFDEQSRPGWSSRGMLWWLCQSWDESKGSVDALAESGLAQWFKASSFGDIRQRLGVKTSV
ncbi:MAG: hypothetical protein GY732_23605, partial [Gammaproteobacteria bacterium]|nr:hypothetical protein [Gammaproteobacteria bacterium]